MSIYNPNKMTWLNPNIEYLFNVEIIEYDMQDAGFNIIKQFKLLDEKTIEELSKLDKSLRNISIGKLRGKDRLLSTMLSEKFSEMRYIFISENELGDNDIVSVKNDAIFTIKRCHKLKFGYVNFVPKNIYTSYIRFTNNSNIELYYSSDGLEIKGIGESGTNRHRLYMVSFINDIMRYIESNNLSVKRYLMKFISQYKSMKLDEGYYIEFNNRSHDIDPIFNYLNVIIPMVQIALKEIV